VGLRSDGTAVATGYNGSGQCDVSGWHDLVAVSASWGHTVGLRSDGTAVATGRNDDGQCDVSGW
jgi:alpha-tubulin suppressor-like RCC1 family protein